MGGRETPQGNRLIDALTDADWQRWRQHLELVSLACGQVLHEPGMVRAHAYFPTSAILSLSCLLENGACTQVALVGDDGFVGTCHSSCGCTKTTQVSVLTAGQAFRIGAQTIEAEFERSDAVRHLFMSYAQALAAQISQTAICYRHHTIDQQVSGWLLHCLDRLRGNEVCVTQDALSRTLGVRRESVTHAAGRLQDAGLIRCARGRIEVLDPEALAQQACECHAVVKKEYDRLLPQGRCRTTPHLLPADRTVAEHGCRVPLGHMAASARF